MWCSRWRPCPCFALAAFAAPTHMPTCPFLWLQVWRPQLRCCRGQRLLCLLVTLLHVQAVCLGRHVQPRCSTKVRGRGSGGKGARMRATADMQHTALCREGGRIALWKGCGKAKALLSVAPPALQRCCCHCHLVLHSLSSAEPPNPFVLLPVQPSGPAPHGGGEPQGTPLQAQGVQ